MKFLNSIVCMTILAAGVATAEVRTLSITQETVPGQSVFVTAPFALLGADDLAHSVKLSPQDYPLWSVKADLPPTAQVIPRYYVRNDSATQVGTNSFVQLIASNGPEDVAIRPVVSKIVTYIAEGDAPVTAILHVYDQNGAVLFDREMARRGGEDTTLFSSEIGPDNFHKNFSYKIETSPGIFLPISGNAIINPVPTTWRYGQAFLGPAPAQPPAAPRVETFTFAPANFRSRTIRVLLPRGYDLNTAKEYPVVYAQDGQNVFSPGGPFGSWDLDLSISSMIRKGELPEIILVGIDNTQDRFAELTPEWGTVMSTSGRGREFLRMIRDELLPVIATKYRVAAGPANTSHLGSSLGGLLGFTASNEFSNVFGAVASMSPSTQVNTTEITTEAGTAPSTRSRFYMDCGTSGDNYAITINVRDAYLQSGHVYGPAFYFDIGPGQQHNEAAWRTRSPKMLRWMYDPFLGGSERPTIWSTSGSDAGTTNTLAK